MLVLFVWLDRRVIFQEMPKKTNVLRLNIVARQFLFFWNQKNVDYENYLLKKQIFCF